MKYYLLLFISGLFLVSAPGCSSVKNAGNISANRDNSEISLKRKLKAGEIHLYSVQLNAGEFLHVKAEQYNIDLIAKVTSAEREFAEQFDSPNGELDAEDIYLLSDKDSRFNCRLFF